MTVASLPSPKKDWKVASENLDIDALLLLREYGRTMQYRHIGIEAAHDGYDGARRFTSDPFAVISLNNKGDMANFSLAHLKTLTTICKELPSNIINDPIKAHMAPLLNRAVKDMIIHTKHIAELPPVFALVK